MGQVYKNIVRKSSLEIDALYSITDVLQDVDNELKELIKTLEYWRGGEGNEQNGKR